MWQYTPPHYLNQPNYLSPLESSSGFSHLRPGVFHISLPTHKIHNREGGRKRRTNKHGLGLAPSVRREKSLTFLCILWANTSVYSSETPTKPRGMLIHFLALVNPASVGQHVLAATLLTSVDWSPFYPTLISWLTFTWLFSPVDSGTFLPLSVSWEISRAGPVWVSRQNRQRDSLTDTHTHRNECHPSCHRCL